MDVSRLRLIVFLEQYVCHSNSIVFAMALVINKPQMFLLFLPDARRR